MVVGDRQPYLSALIVLDPDALPELEVASQISGLSDVASAARNPEVKRSVVNEKYATEIAAFCA